MSLIINHTETVICDICKKPIKRHWGVFSGTRFTRRRLIFERPEHIDICFDCEHKIFDSAKEEGAGDGK